MRKSDVVDILAEVLPKRLVAAVIGSVLIYVAITGDASPLRWYFEEVAAGLTKTLSDALPSLGIS